jgi:hypothetical protein
VTESDPELWPHGRDDLDGGDYPIDPSVDADELDRQYERTLDEEAEQAEQEALSNQWAEEQEAAKWAEQEAMHDQWILEEPPTTRSDRRFYPGIRRGAGMGPRLGSHTSPNRA